MVEAFSGAYGEIGAGKGGDRASNEHKKSAFCFSLTWRDAIHANIDIVMAELKRQLAR